MKIKKIHFEHLRNEAHYQFFRVVEQQIDTDVPVTTHLTGLLAPFCNSLTLEEMLIGPMQGRIFRACDTKMSERPQKNGGMYTTK
jgi:hypothetical protein